MSVLLELDHVCLAYDTPRGMRTVTPSLNLQLERGHIGCLLGASGCGKSTVLRAIAGFEPVRQGRILLEGKLLSSPQQQVEPELRHVGMMFQDYALFPHMNVARNVGFGLRRQDRTERDMRVEEMLEMVGLSKAGDSYPHELSGGQQQRVALARALAMPIRESIWQKKSEISCAPPGTPPFWSRTTRQRPLRLQIALAACLAECFNTGRPQQRCAKICANHSPKSRMGLDIFRKP
jgi:predicted ABC-type transport system involved in lysophospholipase L1 biosynthesis ATPase subunit